MPSRRWVLTVGGLALTGGAGCVGDSTDGTDRTRNRTATSTTTESDATATDDAADAGDATGTTHSDDAGAFRITVVDGDGEVELVTATDVATVGDVASSPRLDGYQLPLTLTDEGTAAFVDGLDRVGAFEHPERHRIRTYFGGELLYEARLGAGLADAMESGEWDGSFVLNADEREAAERVRDALETEGATTGSDTATTRSDGETTNRGGETTRERETTRGTDASYW